MMNEGRTEERAVSINMPFLPIRIEAGEVRWRPLPPIRLRLTLLGLTLVVAIAAMFLSVGAEAVRLRNHGSYHAIETQKAANNRPPGPPFGHTPLEDWHFSMAKYYHSAAEREEAILGVMLKQLEALGTVALLGRIVNQLFWRPSLPPRD
jgi:hypothetical protein